MPFRTNLHREGAARRHPMFAAPRSVVNPALRGRNPTLPFDLGVEVDPAVNRFRTHQAVVADESDYGERIVGSTSAVGASR